MRKHLITTTLASAVISAALVVPAQADVTVASWGGAYTMSQQKAYADTYTGGKVNFINYNGGLGEVRAQVEAGNVTWDIIDVLPHEARVGCDEGLFEELPRDVFTPAADGTSMDDDIMVEVPNNCVVPQIFWSYVPFYQKGAFDGNAAGNPETIADFFDVKNFPGKRGLHTWGNASIEMALMADGVPAAEVYDLLNTDAGVDRAFAKLDTIRDSVVWWEAGAQPPQLLADGEVVMTTAYNGRIFNAVAAEGKPFEIMWDGQVWDLDLWVIPKGASNMEATLDFVKFSTGTQPLADQASYISYGPVRNSSAPLVGSYHNQPELKMGPHMPTAPENFGNALQNDFEFWADNQDQLNERFNAWLSK